MDCPLEILCVRFHRNDVAQIAATGQPARRAVSGKEHEHAIVAMDAAGIGQSIAQYRENLLARGVFIEKREHMIRLEMKLRQQHFFDAVCVIHGIAQLRPTRIVIDPDDYRPALAIQGGRGIRSSRNRRLHRLRPVIAESLAVPS